MFNEAAAALRKCETRIIEAMDKLPNGEKEVEARYLRTRLIGVSMSVKGCIEDCCITGKITHTGKPT